MNKNNEFITPKEASQLLSVHPATLRKWAEQGKIEYTRITNGDRRYKKQDILHIAGIDNTYSRKKVFYVRSSNGKKELLDTQIDLLTSKYGAPDKVYKDKASGLNEKRRGLQSLLNSVEKDEIDTIYVTAKDRLTRFGYTYLERLCNIYGTSIVILNPPQDKSSYEELVEDFLSLLASFSGKYYKLRGNANKKKFLDKINQEFQS